MAVSIEGELESAIARAKGGALVVVTDPMFFRHRVYIAELALRSQVPSIFGGREYVAAGGLMSYLSPNAWHWRSAAGFVDKILKGVKPGDIPVGSQPSSIWSSTSRPQGHSPSASRHRSCSARTR